MSRKNIPRVIDAVKALQEAIGETEFFYHVEQMEIAHNAMLERFSPFKVGDRARLTRDPNITKDHAPGWLGSKHFLTKGCPGTIETVEFYKGLFRFAFRPDNQTWKDSKGNFIPYEDGEGHTYYFSEEWLENAD